MTKKKIQSIVFIISCYFNVTALEENQIETLR